MRRRISAGLFSLLVVVSVLATIPVAGAASVFQAKALKPGTTINASKAISSRLAKTDRSLLRLSGSRLVPVIVKLDYDSVASYSGGMGLAATSPQVTGRSLVQNASAVSAYQQFVASREQADVSAIQARIPGARVTARFRTVYGGVAMRVPANQIRALVSTRGVVAVQRDKMAHTLTDASAHFVGADQVWPQLGGQSLAGDNVLVGDLDTGIWPEHPSFNDPVFPRSCRTFPCQFGDGSDPRLGVPFTCNNKLVGAYAFTQTYMAIESAERGEFCDNATGACSPATRTDTARTRPRPRSASPVHNVSIFDIPKNPISGMAPGARRSCTACAWPWGASTPTRSAPSVRPSRTASTSSTTPSAAATPPTPTPLSSRSSTPTRPASRSTPPPATRARAPRPWRTVAAG